MLILIPIMAIISLGQKTIINVILSAENMHFVFVYLENDMITMPNIYI